MVHSSPSPTLARIPVHLTLLVPELIWPEPADQFTLGKLSAPGLEWLLARARLERRPRQPYETALTGGFARRLETNGGIAALVAGQWTQGRPLAELAAKPVSRVKKIKGSEG